jgi:mono/diheme cytochrome c family protein
VQPARSLAVLVLAFVAGSAAGSDAARGKVLYETHCGSCHYERLHRRESSRINSLAALKLEVVKWSRETGRSFAVQELDDIAEHLNRTHYRLDK